MTSSKLISDLKPMLQQAKELFVSVALLNDQGLDILLNTPAGCKIQILIGVDLPTTPQVLRRVLSLMQKESILFSAKIYRERMIFHPKVYIVRKTDNKIVAYVGSANATQGGMEKNIEMSICLSNPEVCDQLLQWHSMIYNHGSELDMTFIERYELTYRRNKLLNSTQKSNKQWIKSDSLRQDHSMVINSDQFFSQSDFNAFSPVNHFNTTYEAVLSRNQVKNKLLALNGILLPEFDEYGIFDLHLPVRTQDYTSHYWHSRNPNECKDSIWLHYGKSSEQLTSSRNNKMSNNVRIQVIIKNNPENEEVIVGVWLVIGKPFSSYEDRQKLKRSIENDLFLRLFFNFTIGLGDAYTIDTGDIRIAIAELNGETHLRHIIQSSKNTEYFVIRRNYNPNDQDLTEENIGGSLLLEIAKLYKLYDLIR